MGFKYLFGRTLKGTVVDNDRFALKDSAVVSGNPDKNVLGSVLQTYILKPLLDATFAFVNGIKLNASRLLFNEKKSAVISTVGQNWLSIADVEANPNQSSFSEFQVSAVGGNRVGSMSLRLNFSNGSVGKVGRNTIKEIGKSRFGTSQNQRGIIDARIAASDSVSDAGGVLQVLIDVDSTLTINTQIGKNFSSSTNGPACTLIEPVIDNSPTLPDGITAADVFIYEGINFYEFGEVDLFSAVGWTGTKLNDDIIACELDMGDIPIPFTGIVLTLPNISLRLFDGSDPTKNTTIVAPTFSNFDRKGNRIQFRMTETDIALGMTSSDLNFKISGTGGQIELIP